MTSLPGLPFPAWPGQRAGNQQVPGPHGHLP